MIKSYVSEQLVNELFDLYQPYENGIPSLDSLKNGITIQEVAYHAGVLDVLNLLDRTAKATPSFTQIL